MRLWDRKGVGVGEYKAGRLHLVTFLPESSANTAATTHDAAKLGRGGRRGNALLAVLAWLHFSPSAVPHLAPGSLATQHHAKERACGY